MSPQTPSPKLHGSLLLADPTLRDGIFNKSVILIGEHSADDGAFGLILNHPSGKTVGDVLPSEEFSALARLPVHLGGPVSRNNLTFAIFEEKKGKLDFALRIAVDEALARMNHPGTMVRAFAGYSGWSRDQLEDELDRDSWTVTEPTANLLNLAHDITLWKTLMRSLSPYHKILANAPDEILSN
ncbi:MAG: YqgE/AlgH family protein [Akkermansiaceae bacterium]